MLLPRDVFPLYVVQVIVHVPEDPAVHQENGIAQFTEACAVLIATVAIFPFQEAVSVWVKDEDFRLVAIVMVSPSIADEGQLGADFLAIVVSVLLTESFTVPELVLVAYDADTVSVFEPSSLCVIFNVLL
jgi:hypothetical protein